MSYFVYAVHTGSLKNRLYGGPIDGYQEAAELEREMEAGRVVSDNYVVTMVSAKDETKAEEKIRAFRIENGIPI